ncbi:MAG TPA: CDP-diacylglycerol--glycerol-3-phosphate 3-phosphatidyltransferase [Oscillospiraceae bacterium]|jgi:CDP-diacylglycerol--glycerol-3-phosphate 3-phosphatidyltransferase|nr:pgsA [Oscillospiraceae bacterium]HOV40447.1 CDP-diacylglycerol--glycerol-3-phosphate 3-phosphatidyltransferase [Oscillospiraceae bacterium]
MNLPNKLTVLRVLMVPFFVLFALCEGIPQHFFWALLFFAGASITDALDGHIARKNNLITDFGKFLDPLADKILVMAALICFVELRFASSVAVMIIIAREFMVTGLRLVASANVVIPAGIWGKLKTAFTMAAVVLILFMQGLSEAGFAFGGFDINIAGGILVWIAAALTVISGAQYLWAYRKYIDPKK